MSDYEKELEEHNEELEAYIETQGAILDDLRALMQNVAAGLFVTVESLRCRLWVLNKPYNKDCRSQTEAKRAANKELFKLADHINLLIGSVTWTSGLQPPNDFLNKGFASAIEMLSFFRTYRSHLNPTMFALSRNMDHMKFLEEHFELINGAILGNSIFTPGIDKGSS